MWFCLNLDGIELKFRITGYQKSTDQWDAKWCEVDLALRSDEWLNYQIKGQEILLSCEVEQLCRAFEALLNDQITQECAFGCAEPDLTFRLSPKQDARDNPNVLYVKSGLNIADIGMNLDVAFWHDGLTANRLRLAFDRTDIEQLLCYLRLITNEITPDDNSVRQLLESKVICIGVCDE